MPIELEIVKPAFGGDGIAYFSGKVVFVADTLPGEKVLVEITEDKKSFARAKLLEVLSPSPHRQAPKCVYVPYCGGCQYQHVSYAEELRIKNELMAEMFAPLKSFGDFTLAPAVASDREEGYRNSVTLHKILSKKNKPVSLGYISRDNVSRVPVDQCRIADIRFMPVFSWKISPKKEFEKITLKLSDKGEIVSDQDDLFYRVRVGDQTLIANSKGFFQNNLFVASALAAQVAEWTSQISPDRFFDLYAGVGTFSFLCAKDVPRVFAVEENEANLQALGMNREENKMDSLEIVPGLVEKVLPSLWRQEGTERSLLFVDPPRQGLFPSLTDFFARDEKIGALIYVSCDPTTLIRDLKTILAPGRLKLKKVIPFDMFPRTKHLEIACFLSRE